MLKFQMLVLMRAYRQVHYLLNELRLRAVVPIGVDSDLISVVAADTISRVEPDGSASILKDIPDLVPVQTIFHSEICDFFTIESGNTLLPGSKPKVALAVLEDGTHTVLKTKSRTCGLLRVFLGFLVTMSVSGSCRMIFR